jgi:hypothetical protein
MIRNTRTLHRCAHALLGVGLGTLVALTVLEVAARLAGLAEPNFYELDQVLGSRLRAGVSGVWRHEGANHVEINEFGLRDAPGVGPVPKSDELRVLVLGDSFVEALHVPLEETFVQRLEGLLAPAPSTHLKRVEFVNMGCSGYGTAQSYLRFKRDWMAYAPDLVVLCFFGGNDPSDNSRELAVDKSRPFFDLTEDGELVGPDLSFWEATAFRRTPVRRVLRALKNKSAALSWLMYERMRIRLVEDRSAKADEGRTAGAAASRQARIFTDPDTDPALGRAKTLTLALVSALSGAARDTAIPLVVVTVPDAMQIYPEDAESVRESYPRHTIDFDQWDRFLGALCEEEDVPFLATAGALRADYEANSEVPLHYERVGHFTPEGHAAFATALGGYLAQAFPDLLHLSGP